MCINFCEGIPEDIGYKTDDSPIIPEKTRISISQKKKILDYIDCHPNHSFKSIKKRHPAFKHSFYKSRWRYQIECGGSEEEILQSIEEYTLEHFREARKQCKSVHDVDIKRWAVEKSLEFRYRSE